MKYEVNYKNFKINQAVLDSRAVFDATYNKRTLNKFKNIYVQVTGIYDRNVDAYYQSEKQFYLKPQKKNPLYLRII